MSRWIKHLIMTLTSTCSLFLFLMPNRWCQPEQRPEESISLIDRLRESTLLWQHVKVDPGEQEAERPGCLQCQVDAFQQGNVTCQSLSARVFVIVWAGVKRTRQHAEGSSHLTRTVAVHDICTCCHTMPAGARPHRWCAPQIQMLVVDLHTW